MKMTKCAKQQDWHSKAFQNLFKSLLTVLKKSFKRKYFENDDETKAEMIIGEISGPPESKSS